MFYIFFPKDQTNSFNYWIVMVAMWVYTYFSVCITLLPVFIIIWPVLTFCDTGTKEILSFREETCCTGASEHTERPVSNHHCWVAQGSRVVEKLDQILVCS